MKRKKLITLVVLVSIPFAAFFGSSASATENPRANVSINANKHANQKLDKAVIEVLTLSKSLTYPEIRELSQCMIDCMMATDNVHIMAACIEICSKAFE